MQAPHLRLARRQPDDQRQRHLHAALSGGFTGLREARELPLEVTVTFSSSDLAPETVEAASALLTPLQRLLARAAP